MPAAKETPPVLRFRARVKRAGNSLAVFIPAEEAKRLGFGPERDVEVSLRPASGGALGILQRLGVPKADIERIRREWQADKKVMYPDD